jgi:hypothetical protein
MVGEGTFGVVESVIATFFDIGECLGIVDLR